MYSMDTWLRVVFARVRTSKLYAANICPCMMCQKIYRDTVACVDWSIYHHM